jgi:hypothetical protein
LVKEAGAYNVTVRLGTAHTLNGVVNNNRTENKLMCLDFFIGYSLFNTGFWIRDVLARKLPYWTDGLLHLLRGCSLIVQRKEENMA